MDIILFIYNDKNNLFLDFTSTLGSLLVLLTIFTMPNSAKTVNGIFVFYYKK